MTKLAKRIGKREQGLRDEVAYTAQRLKARDLPSPLLHLGPNERYADAFQQYSNALLALVMFNCPIQIADWSWDGYEGSFHFKWMFEAHTREPPPSQRFDTRFVGMHAYARFYDSRPLDDELARVRAEAAHFDEMRKSVIRWAGAQAKDQAS